MMVPAVAAWPREDGLLMLIHDTDARTSVISSRRVPTSGSGLYASKYDHIKGIYDISRASLSSFLHSALATTREGVTLSCLENGVGGH